MESGDIFRPFVTICMATYNRASLVARAIDSVLAQDYPYWELVIVDDGSTDDTPQRVAAYLERDSRVRYVRQPHRGLVAARNHAAEIAHGEWLAFLDSDDELRSDHLARRVAFVSAHPEVDFLHGGCLVVGGYPFVPDVHDSRKLVPIAECIVGGTFFIRRELFLRHGGFQLPDFGCDYELYHRLAPIVRVEKVDFPTYLYHRDVDDSMCEIEARKTARAPNEAPPREDG